ncbi:MAG TPA: TolC family protein [Acetobacteraceae bacterium]|nr:TolC family protein [Acetobacteraceae bacterium]
MLLLPVLLAGCARYTARPISPAANAMALSARRLNDPKLLRFLTAMGHPAPRWGIDTLTLVAVYERPDLRIVNANYAIAQGGLTTAAAIPNPVLGLSPSYNATAPFPSPWKIGPVVSFLITSFGARSANIAAARADIAAAREAVLTAGWQERARVRNALLALWQARAQAQLTSRSAHFAASGLTVLSQRYASGMVSATALNLQRLTAEQARFAATEAVRRQRLARASLAAAIGLPKAALNGVPLDLAAFDHVEAPRGLAVLARQALVRRPAVQAALARYAAAQDRLRVAIDGQYPAFNIGPGYHFDQGNNKFLLTLALPLPIFNQNQGPIAVARARRRLAAAQFDQVQQRVLGAIDTARTNWRASRDVTLAAERAADGAERNEAAARSDFRAGATGRLRLIGAQQAAILAEQDALTARIQARTALGQLEDALHHVFFRSFP